ncbi:MAG: hypothetical protein ACTSRG_12005 [Candidatus Helarchaeota archaeon]
MSEEPKVVKVIQEKGIVDEEIDWQVAKHVMALGQYTPCAPSLVELEGGKQAIKYLIDKTVVEKDGLYGYGIVGSLYVSVNPLGIMWFTPKETLEKNSEELIKTAKPQKRPRKY